MLNQLSSLPWKDYLTGYLILINLIAFVVCLYDKSIAGKKGVRRVPEKTLMGLSALGGAAGMLCGMLLVRHKTKHAKFVIGVPLLLAAQIALLYFVLH